MVLINLDSHPGVNLPNAKYVQHHGGSRPRSWALPGERPWSCRGVGAGCVSVINRLFWKREFQWRVKTLSPAISQHRQAFSGPQPLRASESSRELRIPGGLFRECRGFHCGFY